MNRKLIPLLGIAFVVAVIATGIFYGLIAGKLDRASRAAPHGVLVVAARDIQPGRVITASDLKVSSWAGPEIPEGAFHEPDQAAGLTVLQPIQENEPVTSARLASRDSRGGAALAIPVGMRAVSIHVADSPGVVRLLKPGHKVDVQVIRSGSGPSSGDTELRTILQGVEVMAIDPGEGQGRSGAGVVLTLLAKPAEAEMLSLADSGGRIRVVLRNPLDSEQPSLARRGMASLFHGPRFNAALRAALGAGPKAPLADGKPASAASETSRPPDGEVQLRVRIAGADAGALEELDNRLLAPRGGAQLQVSAFRPGWDLESAIQKLQAKGKIEVFSASYLLAGSNGQVGMRAGTQRPETPAGCGVQIQFLPLATPAGRMRLRVEPAVTWPNSEGVTTRRIETEVEVSDGQSFLVTGLAEPREEACTPEQLFPGRGLGSGRSELVVLVTPRLKRAAPAGEPTAALLARP